MNRITLLACLIALLSMASAMADDDWAWEDLTEVHVNGPSEEDAAPSDESTEPEPVGETEDGEALNFGAYFGNGDEFVNSNVAYNKDLFITITDVDVDAHSGNIDELAYEDDGPAAELPESDVAVENNNPDRPDNVFGPLYGVPDNAVGLNEYRSEDYSGMEPGDEDVVEEEAAETSGDEEETVEPSAFVGGSLDSAIDDARPADEDESAEETASDDEEDASEEDDSADTEESEEGEEAEAGAEDEESEEPKQRQNQRREKRNPEEWWNEG